MKKRLHEAAARLEILEYQADVRRRRAGENK
jgi:hypothetical protein